MKRVRIRVTGVVQGVGFRYYVVRRAREFGLSGWTRNNPDGSVEIEAVGNERTLKGFVEEVRIGPPGAHIAGLTVEQFNDDPGYDGFEIRF
ncbi:MAG: acylphosphatase [candidate division Zixibacteria bacterium]|nr:acylphosphatase [candidate division Zixibacteria bacterium]